MSTDQRLIEAAASLLDAGGQSAVTIRAVAQAVGMSHNVPYKHFKDRDALLRAIAIRDFTRLTGVFKEIRLGHAKPREKLEEALRLFISYGLDSPARYRLLFSDPDIAAQAGELEAAARQSFAEFANLVQECQTAQELPDVPTVELTGLIYASVHGLIDLQLGGRLRQEKGLSNAHQGVELLMKLLVPVQGAVEQRGVKTT